MQVFVPYPSPIDTAMAMSNDKLRLRKQVLECDQILAAIFHNSQAWSNHPITKMYSGALNATWLWYYRETLDAFLHDCPTLAKQYSYQCDTYFRPTFLTDSFCDQHKRRLYTKAPELYPQFASYGKSDENWYFVDGEIVKYVNGKRI